MAAARNYHRFTCRDAAFRICCSRIEAVTAEIVAQRGVLESYIERHPEFGASLEPLEVQVGAPPVAAEMARAALAVGVGPMAAVAGAMAERAARAGLAAGADEVIVENGGDIFLQASAPVMIGLHPGPDSLPGRLAFAVEPHQTPLAICSSSGRMGHSLSLGDCDLATVVAESAALADAAATRAANLVRRAGDIEETLEQIAALEGVQGLLLVRDGHVGMAGRLPELVRGPLTAAHQKPYRRIKGF